MLHFRKSYEVIGYAFEADTYCLDCTQQRFGGNSSALDYTAIDGEGNAIHPVFLGDEFDTPPHCGNCHIRLDGEDDISSEDLDDTEDLDGDE